MPSIQEIASKYGATYVPPQQTPQQASPYATLAQKYGATFNPPPSAPGTFAGTSDILSKLSSDPLSLNADIGKATSDAWNSIKDAVQQEGQNISNLFSAKSVAQGVGEGLKTVAGAAGVAFSPLTALFKGAEQVPVLGSVSKIITLPFSAVGEGAAGIGGAIVDQLPISQEAKDQVKPGVQEIFALAGQLALGKVADLAFRQKTLVEKYGKEDAQTIVTEAKKLAEQQKAQEASVASAETPAKPQAPAIPPELQSLAQEARKYKSAEEFVKAQTNTYHGSPVANLSEIKAGSEIGAGQKIDVPYISKEKTTAEQYILNRNIDDKGLLQKREIAQTEYEATQSDSSLKALEKIDGQIQALVNKQKTGAVTDLNFSGRSVNPFSKSGGQEIKNILKNADTSTFTPKEQRIVSNILSNNSTEFLTSKVIDESPNIRKLLAQNNIHGLEYPHDALPYSGGENGTQIAVLDKSKLLTKSQLTDFYNKVTAKPEATGMVPVRTAKAAADVAQSAAEAGFNALPEELQAKYTPTTKQATLAEVDRLMTNIDEGRAVIRGEKFVSRGVELPLFNAMEKYALRTGNTEILAELQKSPIASEGSILGQALGSKGFNNNPHSPLNAIRDITEARIEKVRREGKSVAKEKTIDENVFRKEIKASRSPRPKWEEFLNELKCNI